MCVTRAAFIHESSAGVFTGFVFFVVLVSIIYLKVFFCAPLIISLNYHFLSLLLCVSFRGAIFYSSSCLIANSPKAEEMKGPLAHNCTDFIFFFFFPRLS